MKMVQFMLDFDTYAAYMELHKHIKKGCIGNVQNMLIKMGIFMTGAICEISSRPDYNGEIDLNEILPYFEK